MSMLWFFSSLFSIFIFLSLFSFFFSFFSLSLSLSFSFLSLYPKLLFSSHHLNFQLKSSFLLLSFFLWFFQFQDFSPFLSLPLLLSPFSPPGSNLLIFLNLKSHFSFSFYLNILFLTWIPSSLASTTHLQASILGGVTSILQYSCTFWPKLFLLVFLHLFCSGFKGS